MRISRERDNAVLLWRARLGHTHRRGDILRPLAALANSAHKPWGLPGTLPAPVLFEVILARLASPAGDVDNDADEPVEHGVYEDAAGKNQ